MASVGFITVFDGGVTSMTKNTHSRAQHARPTHGSFATGTFISYSRELCTTRELYCTVEVFEKMVEMTSK
jgi:hypothetical protein